MKRVLLQKFYNYILSNTYISVYMAIYKKISFDIQKKRAKKRDHMAPLIFGYIV